MGLTPLRSPTGHRRESLPRRFSTGQTRHGSTTPVAHDDGPMLGHALAVEQADVAHDERRRSIASLPRERISPGVQAYYDDAARSSCGVLSLTFRLLSQ